jgi:tryptophan synthase alpha subunit
VGGWSGGGVVKWRAVQSFALVEAIEARPASTVIVGSQLVRVLHNGGEGATQKDAGTRLQGTLT